MNSTVSILLGFAAGFAVAKYTSPICRAPRSGPFVVPVQSTARGILNIGERIQDARPLLQPIADGRVPSPHDLVRAGARIVGVN